MFQARTTLLPSVGVIICICGCSSLERKVFVKRIDFEVDAKANKGNPFVCHIAVPYSSDLVVKLHGMDAQTYFTQLSELQRLYKDKLEIFSYDIIPGKSRLKEKVEPRSRTKAFGAYIFAKYTINGKFAERLGLNKKILVKFEEYKMTIYDGTSKEPQFDDKCAGSCPTKDLPKTDSKAEPECTECPPGYDYMEECEDGTKRYLPEKKYNNNNPEECVECPTDAEYAVECDDGSVTYLPSNKTNEECVKCPNGHEYATVCDDGTVNYIPYQSTLSKQTNEDKKQKTNVPSNKKFQSTKH